MMINTTRAPAPIPIFIRMSIGSGGSSGVAVGAAAGACATVLGVASFARTTASFWVVSKSSPLSYKAASRSASAGAYWPLA
jgi:hypothetical protein